MAYNRNIAPNPDNNRHQQKELRRQLRNHATPAEAILWRMLRARQVCGLLWRRQFGAGPYVLDFYCPALKLCIELDGEPHFTDCGIQYDEQRTEYLERTQGIEVIRFENRVVFECPEAILREIERRVEREAEEIIKKEAISLTII